MTATIFCPKCGDVVLGEARCRACGWLRPPAAETVGQAVWCADLRTRLIKPACYPVIAAGLYLLGTEDGTLLALDLASGKLAWEKRLPGGSMAHSLCSDGERLFVGCEDVQPIPSMGKLFLALDARNGEERWQFGSPAHSLSAAATAEGRVYFTSSDGLLHALEAGSGRQVWQVEHEAWAPAAPAVGGGVVLAGGRRDTMVGYDALTGAERWRVGGGGWFAGPACVAGDRAYATGWDGWIYAVEVQTGRLTWKVKGERDNGFTTPPTAAGERLFAGSRVYREVEGKRKKVYAMLALSAADGKELWRAYSERHIYPPAEAAEGIAFFGADDRLFYAVEEATGRELWRMELKSRVVTRPLAAGDRVYFAGRDGLVHAVRWRSGARPEDQDPEALLAEGRAEEAAAVWALKGELAKAAALYAERLRSPRGAALLYERAGLPGLAAPQREALGDLQRARDLYGQAGDRAGLAGVLVKMNEPLQAARLYEEVGLAAEAARLYEQAGDRIRAGELYEAVGRSDLAAQIWQSLGRWENLVRQRLLAGDAGGAARLLAQNRQEERAAELYEQAGQLRDALGLRRALQHWERVAELAAQLNDPEQQGIALEKTGQRLAAADAFERAGKLVAGAQPVDAERAAGLYEQAQRLFEAELEGDRAVACTQEVRRLRRLPDIVAVGQPRGEFVEFEWNPLTLEVRNTGFGPAGRLVVEVGGPFDLDGQTTLASLPPGRVEALPLSIRAHKEQVGPAVPLEIRVTFHDRRGRPETVRKRVTVPVVKRGGLLGEMLTPQQIIIQGDLVERGAKKFGGHEIQEGGQLGDKVVIGRGGAEVQAGAQTGDRVEIHGAPGGRRIVAEPGEDGVAVEAALAHRLVTCGTEVQVQVRPGAGPVRSCKMCNLPIEDAQFRHCPDCGAPLPPAEGGPAA